MAALLYADDNGGRSFVILWGVAGELVVPTYPNARWLDLILPYLGNRVEPLECPSQLTERASFYQAVPPYGPRKYYPGYLLNAQTQNFYQSGYPALTLSKITNWQAILFAEGALNYQTLQDGWSPQHCIFFVNASGGVQPVSKRHRGGSNFVALDGHAEWQPYEKIQPIGRSARLCAGPGDLPEVLGPQRRWQLLHALSGPVVSIAAASRFLSSAVNSTQRPRRSAGPSREVHRELDRPLIFPARTRRDEVFEPYVTGP